MSFSKLFGYATVILKSKLKKKLIWKSIFPNFSPSLFSETLSLFQASERFIILMFPLYLQKFQGKDFLE